MNKAVEDHDTATLTVAGQIRRLREGRGLSQQALADASRLSRNTLSLLERGQSSPTVKTLEKLAEALQVDIGAFFQIYPQVKSIVHKPVEKPYTRDSTGTPSGPGDCQVNQLVTALIMRLEPGACSDSVQLHSGQEYIYCLCGQIACSSKEETYLLEPGDSLHVDGYQYHRYQNLGREPSEALLIVSMAEDGSDLV